MSSRDGVPGCRCNKPLVDITGTCRVCGLEKLHVLPKTPLVTTYLPDSRPAVDGDGDTKAAA